MTIDLKILSRNIKPDNTVLLFGAGSSIPSGGPTGQMLASLIAKEFNVDFDPTLTLADIATLAEINFPRRQIIKFIEAKVEGLRPTKGLLNLPLFDWQDLFTTNYDTLIEQAYRRASKELRVYSSNFDFGDRPLTEGTELFKIHGTIGQDRSLGHQASMVVTNEDYDKAEQFRELAFDRLLHETSRHDVVIIGHSLADPDLMKVINESIRRKRQSGAPGKLYALIFLEDKNRAALIEQRDISVCFGGVDDFFSAMSAQGPAAAIVHREIGDGLDRSPQLRPVTIDVEHSLKHEKSSVVRLFNGGAATYGDINLNLTFARDVTQRIESQLAATEMQIAYVLGAAGFGKSTACRQVLANLTARGFKCWEHDIDHPLDADGWTPIADDCKEKKLESVLFVDDAQIHLRELDRIIDHLAETNNHYFRILLASSQGQWHPRAKTPTLFKIGQEHELKTLSTSEIDSLIALFERNKEIAALVEPAFGGFGRSEKTRRLQERCKNDMFVCLKNIFGSDKLDDIILIDYGKIEERLQEIYKVVAAMEASNIRVHRQLVMRIFGIPANVIGGILGALADHVTEYSVDEKRGIYAWRGRHKVISEIILTYKFHDQDQLFELYKKVIDQINPTYEIERMTTSELCDPQNGIGRLTDRDRQNFLYRRLISVAPSQRVPRHRLVQNLIREREYTLAENEIRIFEKELKFDAPMLRYKALVLVGRARNTPGLMKEDRIAMLRDAANLIDDSVSKFPSYKNLYAAYCDTGLGIAELEGKWDVFDAAIERLEEAAKEFLDPEMARMIGRYKAKARGQ